MEMMPRAERVIRKSTAIGATSRSWWQLQEQAALAWMFFNCFGSLALTTPPPPLPRVRSNG
jgi:hypothetical protein